MLIMLRCIVFTTLAAFATQVATASETPQSPSAPPSLTQKAPTDPFRCQRQFVYQGRTLDCDSQVRRDAEKLRPILKDVPAAVSELDAYQQGRRALRYTAYTASIGLAVAIVASFFAKPFRNPPEEGFTLKPASYLVIGGALATVGSFVFGFSLYQSNESHLNEAVNQFNIARPDTPIALEFKTGISF
jgi:hypothetical protein